MNNNNKQNLVIYFIILLLNLSTQAVSSNNDTFLDAIQYDNIVNYQTKDYLGGSHVWCIEKGSERDLYLATNKGLSVFDGYTWRNYKNSNNAILRWLHYDRTADRLYCALDNEFGYWKKNLFGQYNYYLLYKNQNPLFSEIFWRIENLEDIIYFQTQQKIYSYNKGTQEIKEILSKNKIGYLYKYQDILYTQVNDELYKYFNNKFEPTGLIIKSRIIDLVSLNSKMYLVTEDQGILEVEQLKLIQKKEPINKILSTAKAFSAYQLAPDKVVVGSVLDGAFVINEKLLIEKHLDFNSGLKHTTVLSIGSDSKSALWLGLDGGVAQIIDKPAEIILTTTNIDFGSIYDAKYFQNRLYAATNKGLFRFEDKHNVHFIEGSQGQIWSLSEIDYKTLIICHDAGLFQFESANNSLRKIGEDRLWRLIQFENNPNILLGLNMDQFFSIYEKHNNTISLRHKIKNLEVGNTDAYIDRYGYIWTQDRSSNPIKIQLDNDLNIKTIKTYSSIIGKADSLIIAKVDGDVIFYTKTQAYIYDIATDSIIISQHCSNLIRKMQFPASQIEQIGKDIFFYTSGNQIAYIKRNGGKFYNFGEIFQSTINNEITSSSHKIIPLSDVAIATGIEGGIAIYFIQNHENAYKNKEKLEITQIELHHNTYYEPLPISEQISHSLNYSDNYLRVYFKNLYPNNLIEYRLGKDQQWTVVKGFPYFDIPKLPSGKYVICFRNADIYNTDANSTCVLQIEVAYPWYINPFFFIILICLIVSIIFVVRYFFNKRLREQQKKLVQEQIIILEKEKKEFDLEILQLRLEEEEKKMVSLTMESIKYNAILNEIKAHTRATKEESKDLTILNRKIKNILKSIDFYLNEEDPNKIFEKHLNTIHKGFYNRLTDKHPDLSRSEMKLCAYIKLNMSIKEIAAHINIASSSVEIARYRLRKKLNLDTETNLQEYIRKI